MAGHQRGSDAGPDHAECAGSKCWLKTRSGRGLHVVGPLAPRYDYTTVERFSQTVIQHMANAIPAGLVAKSGPSKRVGKLFIDYLRNGRGATPAAAFRRGRARAWGCRMPVSRDDLLKLTSGAQWNCADCTRAPIISDCRTMGEALEDSPAAARGNEAAGIQAVR